MLQNFKAIFSQDIQWDQTLNQYHQSSDRLF